MYRGCRKLFCLVFFIILLWPQFMTSPVLANDIDEEAASLYERGMDFEDRGDYNRAIKFFGRLIRKFPHSKWSDDSLFFIGECFGKLEEYRKAIKAYKRVVIQSNSKDLCADALYMIGESYLKLKDYPNAVMVFKALKKNYPDSIWATDIDRQISKFSMDTDKMLATDTAKNKVSNLDSSDISSQQQLGKKQIDLKTKISSSDSINPEYFVVNTNENKENSNMDSVLYEVALNFHEKGLYEKALEIYERIINNFSSSIWYEDVLYMSGEARIAQGNYENALKDYQRVLKGKKPAFYADAQFMVAECFLTLKKYDLAIKNYQKLIEIYPNSEWKVDARYMIGECNIALGNFKKAADVFKELIKEFPKSDWTVNVKQALVELGGKETIELPGEKEVKRVNKSVSWRAHYDLGLKYKNSKNYKKAIDEFEETVRLNPRFREAWWALSLIYTQDENYNQASKTLEKAAELSKNNPDVFSLLGYTYYLNKEYEKSIDAYKKALASDGDAMFIRDVTYAISKIKRKMKNGR